MSKITEGKWEAIYHPSFNSRTVEVNGIQICSVNNKGRRSPLGEEAEANAIAISKVPEMIELLEELVDPDRTSLNLYEIIEQGQKLLKEIEGE